MLPRTLVPTGLASYDGRFYPRYPAGDAPRPTLYDGVVARVGTSFVNGSGTAIQLRGINLSGLEGGGVQQATYPWGFAGWGPVAGSSPTQEPAWSYIATWNPSVIRCPLNAASVMGLTVANTVSNNLTVTTASSPAAGVPLVAPLQNSTYGTLVDLTGAPLTWSGATGTYPVLFNGNYDPTSLATLTNGSAAIQWAPGLVANAAPYVAITGLSWSAGTVTVTTSSQVFLGPGQGVGTNIQVQIAGCTPAAYNGFYAAKVTNKTGPYTFTFPLATDPGTATVLGQANLSTVAVSWGPTFNAAGPAGIAGEQKAVIDVVIACRQMQCYVDFDLHWTAPQLTFGGVTNYLAPKAQGPGPDQTALAFWQFFPVFLAENFGSPSFNAAHGYNGGAAGTYYDPNFGGATGFGDIIFELYNEPFLNNEHGGVWSDNTFTTKLTDPDAALLTGCWSQYVSNYTQNAGGINGAFYSPVQWAGYQAMLNAIRATGATNVCIINGNQWTQILGDYLNWKPTDTLSPAQIAIGWHAYPNSNGPPGDPTQGTNPYPYTLSGPVPKVSQDYGHLDGGTPTFVNVQWATDVLTNGDCLIITEHGGIGGSRINEAEPMVTWLKEWCDANGVSSIQWAMAYMHPFNANNDLNSLITYAPQGTSAVVPSQGAGVYCFDYMSSAHASPPRAYVRQVACFAPSHNYTCSKFYGQFALPTLAGSTILVFAIQSGATNATLTVKDGVNGTYTALDHLWQSGGRYTLQTACFPNAASIGITYPGQTAVTGEAQGSSDATGAGSGTLVNHGSGGKPIVPGTVAITNGTVKFTDTPSGSSQVNGLPGQLYNGASVAGSIAYDTGVFSFTGGATSAAITANYSYYNNSYLEVDSSVSQGYVGLIALEVTNTSGLIAHTASIATATAKGTDNINAGSLACGSGAGTIFGLSLSTSQPWPGTAPVGFNIYGSYFLDGTTTPWALLEYAHVVNAGVVTPTFSANAAADYFSAFVMLGDS